MKSLLVILSLILLNVAAKCNDSSAIYFSADLTFGNYKGFDINLNFIGNQKWSFKVGGTGLIRKPVSRPTDYTGGIENFLSFGTSNPYDILNGLHLCAGRVFKRKDKPIRFNLNAGIGFTRISEPNNWAAISHGDLNRNYTWEYDTRNAISLIINPKMEFPFSKIFGLSVSPLFIGNLERQYVGVGIGYILGDLGA